MKGRRFRKSLPYLLPSGTGTTLFYTAPFLVMLLYAFSGGGGLAALGGNHAFAVGARNTAVFCFAASASHCCWVCGLRWRCGPGALP